MSIHDGDASQCNAPQRCSARFETSANVALRERRYPSITGPEGWYVNQVLGQCFECCSLHITNRLRDAGHFNCERMLVCAELGGARQRQQREQHKLQL